MAIKTKINKTVCLLSLAMLMCGLLPAQSLQLQPELKELVKQSLGKDYRTAGQQIDKKINLEQQKAVWSAYLPTFEIGGKYLYAYSPVNSKDFDITGFESIGKLQEFMQTPAFPLMFPNMAGLSAEITKLEQLMAKQGISLLQPTDKLKGDLSGNYVGVDATLKMLLYSGGQVPNTAKALGEKTKAIDALTEKCESDVISDVITCYDQLALLNQSKKVLDESSIRLAAEKKYAVSALNNGMATSFDTLKIAVAEANLQSKIADYENKRVLLHHKLAQLTGRPAESFENISPQLSQLVVANTSSNVSNRPELKALEAGVEAKKYLLNAANSHYLPKVQALATARYDDLFHANANLDDPLPMDLKVKNLGLGPTLMAGVGFKWDIYNRPSGISKVKQAKLEVLKAENARDEALELLELNQVKVTSAYDAGIAQVAYKQKQTEAARKALQLAEKSYNEGMLNITERLAAETEVQNAELEYLQSIFAERQAALECYKATGSLSLTNIQ